MASSKSKENQPTIDSLQAKIRELDNVIANMPGNVYWMDSNHIYQGCNYSQAQKLNLSTRQEIVGQKNNAIWYHQASELDSISHRVMESGVPYVGEEKVPYLHEDDLVYLSHKVPLHDEQGKVIGLLGVSIDITDRKRIEKELQIAKEQAEVANQTKTEFIRNMEHDIRTPLCGVMSVVNYLVAIEADMKKKEFLNDIQIATKELLNYLDNIVEFSQINTGVVPFIQKDFNLQQLIQGIINLESAAAKDKKIDLLVIYPEHVPKNVIGDRFRIHRVLLNLINNAIKFTDQGHVKINVDLIEQRSEEEVVLKISVEDTGMGIEEKHREMIFDKFTRCDLSNKGIYKGTGLGLWIVRHFIQELQGKILLESKFGKGSVFTCHFPFQLSKNEEFVAHVL